MSSMKDIYWMCEPLFFADRTDRPYQKLKELNNKISERPRLGKTVSEYNKKVGKYLEPKVRDLVDPKKGSRKFPQIKHWTLEVDGKCYELSAEPGRKVDKFKLGRDACEPRWDEEEKWRKLRDQYDIGLDRRKVGQTKLTHKEIWTEAQDIWKTFNVFGYEFFTANCQNFAKLLYTSIAVKQTPESMKAGGYESIPDPVGNPLARAARPALAGRAISGAHTAYAASAASLAAPAAPIVEGASTAGAAGVTTVSTGTVAAGGTTGAVGGSAGAAGGTTAGVAGGTGAVTGSTAGVTGSTGAVSGTTAAAGTGATSTTGVAGTSAGAGKVGIGAKLGFGSKAAAVGHGAAGTKGAAIAGTMAKAGVVAAYAHPVTGAVMTTGLVYIVAKRGHEKYVERKKRKGQQSADEDDELTFVDMLEAEEKLLEKANNDPDYKVDEDELLDETKSPNEIDEDLAGLTLVITEPGTIRESHGEGEVLLSGNDTKRSQTLA